LELKLVNSDVLVAAVPEEEDAERVTKGVLGLPNVISLLLHFTNEMQYSCAGEFIMLFIMICCQLTFKFIFKDLVLIKYIELMWSLGLYS